MKARNRGGDGTLGSLGDVVRRHAQAALVLVLLGATLLPLFLLSLLSRKPTGR